MAQMDYGPEQVRLIPCSWKNSARNLFQVWGRYGKQSCVIFNHYLPLVSVDIAERVYTSSDEQGRVHAIAGTEDGSE